MKTPIKVSKEKRGWAVFLVGFFSMVGAESPEMYAAITAFIFGEAAKVSETAETILKGIFCIVMLATMAWRVVLSRDTKRDGDGDS